MWNSTKLKKRYFPQQACHSSCFVSCQATQDNRLKTRKVRKLEKKEDKSQILVES